MKKKLSLLTLIVFLGILLVTGCGGSNEKTNNTNDSQSADKESGGKEQEVRIAHNMPAEHSVGIYFKVLAEEIDKRTQETSIHLKPQIFPDGQLYNDTQLPDAITTGGLEIGQITTGFLAGEHAEPLRIVDLPFLFNSWEAEWAAEDGKYGQLFGQQMEKMGMKLLGWPMYGTLELYGNFPIQVPDDVNGKKMRGFGQGATLMLQELGASPVSMSSQEIYQAMEHGTIDGYTTGPSSVIDRSLFETTEYGTDMTVLYLSFQATANLDWFNSLPEDVQNAIIEASEVAQEQSRQEAKESDEKYRRQLVEEGVELYKPTPEEYEQWVEAASTRYDEYLEKAGELGQQFMEAVQEANEQHSAE